MRDLKPGMNNLTYPFLALTPTNTSGNYSLRFTMKFGEFWCLLSFQNGEHFSFWRRTERERTFSDKKLRLRLSSVRFSTVRLCNGAN